MRIPGGTKPKKRVVASETVVITGQKGFSEVNVLSGKGGNKHVSAAKTGSRRVPRNVLRTTTTRAQKWKRRLLWGTILTAGVTAATLLTNWVEKRNDPETPKNQREAAVELAQEALALNLPVRDGVSLPHPRIYGAEACQNFMEAKAPDKKGLGASRASCEVTVPTDKGGEETLTVYRDPRVLTQQVDLSRYNPNRDKGLLLPPGYADKRQRTGADDARLSQAVRKIRHRVPQND